jgi:hypothetical protein
VDEKLAVDSGGVGDDEAVTEIRKNIFVPYRFGRVGQHVMSAEYY